MKVRLQTASRSGVPQFIRTDIPKDDYNLAVPIARKTRASADRSSGFQVLPPTQQPHSSPQLKLEVSFVSGPSSAVQSRYASQR